MANVESAVVEPDICFSHIESILLFSHEIVEWNATNQQNPCVRLVGKE
jgi:hypothetical protein